MLLQDGQTAASISGNGATITQWQVGELHLLYPLQNTFNRNGELKRRGGWFIGAPVFGHPPKAMERGLPQHGWIRDRKPIESKQTHTNAAQFDFVALKSNEPNYPFPWRLQVNVAVYDREIKHKMHVQRYATDEIDADVRMPFNIGGHPYFNAPGNVIIGKKIIPFQDMLKTRKMRVPKNGLVRIEVEHGIITMRLNGYNWLNLWSDHGDKYFCVEPLLDHPWIWGNRNAKKLHVGVPLILECVLTFSETI